MVAAFCNTYTIKNCSARGHEHQTQKFYVHAFSDCGVIIHNIDTHLTIPTIVLVKITLQTEKWQFTVADMFHYFHNSLCHCQRKWKQLCQNGINWCQLKGIILIIKYMKFLLPLVMLFWTTPPNTDLQHQNNSEF